MALCPQPAALGSVCDHLWGSPATATVAHSGGRQSSYCRVGMLLSEDKGQRNDIKN